MNSLLQLLDENFVKYMDVVPIGHYEAIQNNENASKKEQER